VNEFKHSRTSTCDAPRPIEAATPEIINKIHDIVLTDRRVREFVEITGLSHSTVISISHEQLDMKIGKMPHLLTVDHKRDHVMTSKQWNCFNVIQMNFCVNSLL